jgi:tripeptide aminopeptidase
VFTVCEETSLGGSKHVQLGEQIQMGFVVDSSMRPGQFIYRTYGSQGFNIQVTGKAAHSGIHPEDGISSIQVAAQAIANLQLGRVDLETTANIGIIQGGTATNVIPEKTSLAGEVRSLQIEKVHQVIQKIRTEFQNTGQKFNAKVEFESHWDFKPFYVKSGSAAYDKIVITLQALGINPEPVITAGGSDANSLNAKGISAVNIGIGAQNPHSNSEFILLEDLQKTADIVLQLMKAT